MIIGSQRVVDDWDALPDSIKEANTVDNNMRQYRRHIDGTVVPAPRGDFFSGERFKP